MSTFSVDCSGVFGPFWGSKVSLTVDFCNFFFGRFVHEKKPFLNQWASFFLPSSAHHWQAMKRVNVDACMSAIMHAHSKTVCFECIFRFFLFMNIDSLFLIRILTVSFLFLNRSNPIGFRKVFKKEWQVHRLSLSPTLCFWAKDHHRRWLRLLRRSRLFHCSPTTAGLRLMLWNSGTSSETIFQKVNIDYNHYSYWKYQTSFCLL